MSKRAARFTQADLARCIRAARLVGAAGVEIRPDGTIEIKLRHDDVSPARPVATPLHPGLANWDDV
jgi:hypothetical protein